VSKPFTPREYGHLIVDHIVEHPRCAVWAPMGFGKTVNTLTALDTLDVMHGSVWPALALGPLRVARKVWSEEAQKWDHTAGLRVSKVIGTAEERIAALLRPAEIYAMNYENVAWLVHYLKSVKRMPFRTIISDEARRLKAHRIKQGGVMTSALSELAWHSKMKQFIELTGTPAPNGLKDLWGQMWFLDRGTRLGLTYDSFENRWFAYKRIRDAIHAHKTHIQTVIHPHSDQEIHSLVADLCLSLKVEDWFDVALPIFIQIPVDMPKEARRHYREMERALFTQIEGHEIEAFAAAAKSQKLLQLANGAAYLDPDVESDEDPRARAYKVTHNAKIEALESLVEESGGMPLLVAYNFKSDLARLLKAFPDGRALKSEKDEDDFKAGLIPLLFVHPKSAGHGIDGFQNVTNIVVFFGENWDMELRQQVIERIGPVRQMQSGFNRPVYVYDIVAADSIDEDVLARHESKKSVQELLLAAAQRRKRNG
jgi:SNF2 family DNA or RNA helicase